MIELELKYEIETIPKVLKNYEIINKKEQIDIQYDTPNYDLIYKGNFLRIRDGKRLEFKLFAGDTSHLYCKETDFELDQLSNNKDIINELLKSINLKTVEDLNTFNQIIESNNFIVLSPIIKHRTTYKYDEECTISIDEVDDLGLFMECEIMIDINSLSEEKANKIKEQFISKLKGSKIITGKEKNVNIGYVELYLLKHNIKAYNLGIYKT